MVVIKKAWTSNEITSPIITPAFLTVPTFRTGSEADDNITGGGRNDVIEGLGGNDTLSGGKGTNEIDGGTGSDTVDYGWVTEMKSNRWGAPDAGVDVDLQQGRAMANGTYDTIRNVENVIGTDFADRISGNSEDNHLAGGAGNDTFKGHSGRDTIDGGEGTDTVRYDWSESGVYVDLQNGFANTGVEAGETLNSIENVVGSAYDDTIVGNEGDNAVTGGGGRDVFRFMTDWGHDTVTDFDPATDLLDFNFRGVQGMDSLTIEAVDGGSMISAGGNTVFLPGVSPDQLTTDNVLFEDPTQADMATPLTMVYPEEELGDDSAPPTAEAPTMQYPEDELGDIADALGLQAGGDGAEMSFDVLPTWLPEMDASLVEAAADSSETSEPQQAAPQLDWSDALITTDTVFLTVETTNLFDWS
jgi:hypothetical protein